MKNRLEKLEKDIAKIDDFLGKTCLCCDVCQKYYHKSYDLSHARCFQIEKDRNL